MTQPSPKGPWDVFLCAGLRGRGCVERNNAIIDFVKASGCSIYAPQIELPLDSKVPDEVIFRSNCAALITCRMVIFVPTNAGEGAFLELGIALNRGTHTVVYSPTPPENFGAMMRGYWAQLPSAHKITKINDLRPHLDRLQRQTA